MIKKFAATVLGAAVLALGWMGVRANAEGESDAEKQARLDRFDQGPATIHVSKYPPGIQDKYAVFRQHSSQCHRLSRPVNSDYVLPDQWSRHIKCMMYKPGSNSSRSDAKSIYGFLVYDSSVRKKKELEVKLKSLAAEERAVGRNAARTLRHSERCFKTLQIRAVLETERD